MTHQDRSTLAPCIDDCTNCHRVCLETIQHCLKKGGAHVEADHLGLMMLCAEICQTSANAMTLGVHQHVHTCRACAEICEACAKSCAAMESDPVMKACAETCARCAQSCRRMAA